MIRLWRLVGSPCLQQHGFWVKLGHRPTHLPVPLQILQSWESLMSKMADTTLPQALSMPDCAYPQHAAVQASALKSAITSRQQRMSASCQGCTMAGHQGMQACLQKSCAMPLSPSSLPLPIC